MCICRRTVSPTRTIFNKVHATSNNNIHKIQEISRIFTRVKAFTGGQTDKHFSYINTSQVCWKMLKTHLLLFLLVLNPKKIRRNQYPFLNGM